MFNYQNITLGADPEVFLVDKNGLPVSAEGKIGGTKEMPKRIPELAEGFAVQEDNVAAEFNIPPSKSAEEFDTNLFRGLRYLTKVAKKNGHKLAFVDSLHFSAEALATPHAQRLGCEPDLNAWLQRYNPAPNPPATLRTAAGHVHIGYLKPTDDSRFNLAKACDLFLGVPSILVTPKTERRSLYGKAGAIRMKPYGIEYRSLSNWWIANKNTRQEVWNKTMQMLIRLNKEQQYLVEGLDEHEEMIVDCINNHDKDLAIELMDNFDISPFSE